VVGEEDEWLTRCRDLDASPDHSLTRQLTRSGSLEAWPLEADADPVAVSSDRPRGGSGYPVIAVVLDEDTDQLAQARPGDRIRFFLRRAPTL